MNVGEATDLGQAANRGLSAVHDPIGPPMRPNPGHALLIGVFRDDVGLLDQLALLVELQRFTDSSLALSKATFGR